MRNVLILINLGLITWIFWRYYTRYVTETFVLDVPDSVDMETVSFEVLESFNVYKASALDHDGIIDKCTSLEAPDRSVQNLYRQ